jgi:catechol 2,3-dioxygenase-like lactoylglutathione lyase family enzyme
VAGHGARRDHWAALAREVLERLDDEEDRELIASQLASVPGVSLESAAERDARPDYRVARIDHVQVAMPQGRESEAEAFYGGLLGLEVRAKPPALAARGGRWFEDDDVKVHLGVEAQFRPAEKAHPGLVVEGLDRLVEALAEAGYPATWDTENPGARRCFVADPFGNRIELIDG